MKSTPYFCKRLEQGVTLFEVLLAQLILLLMVSLAVPAYAVLQRSYEKELVKQQFASDIRYARERAYTNGAKSFIVIQPDSNFYTVGLDYLPYNVIPYEDTSDLIRTLATELSLYSDDTIIFNAEGVLVDANGSPASVEVQFLEKSIVFANARIFPTGVVDFD